MAKLTMDALRKQLKSGEVDRCYLLYGKERYLLDYYCRELRKAVLGSEDDPFNLRRLEGKGLELQALADAVDAYPAFAEKTLVEVRDYDILQLPEAEIGRLTELLKELPEYCCLVFICDTLEFKTDKLKNKKWEGFRSCVSLVEFPQQGQNELARWVQRHFDARGKKIGDEDAAYLVFLCGSEMDSLTNEIGKLAVYAAGKTVTREEIDAVAVPAVEAQTFKLTDALSSRDYDRAAELMFKLFQLGTEPIPINAMIGSQLRKLHAALLVKQSGGNAGTLAELLGCSDYAARQYFRICSSFHESWYRRMIRLSAETDWRMKSTSEEPEDLLRSLFVTMAAEA